MDASDFKQIFLPCHRRLYIVAWRLTGNQQEAEDLVQDALLRLWTKRDSLEIPDNAEGFAVITLRNIYYDRQRKGHLKENAEEPAEPMMPSERDVSTGLEERQAVSLMRRVIDTLPDKQRSIIIMRDIDDLSYEEIQTRTGLTPVNIRVALSRARKAVRDKLKGLGA